MAIIHIICCYVMTFPTPKFRAYNENYVVFCRESASLMASFCSCYLWAYSRATPTAKFTDGETEMGGARRKGSF